MEQMMDRNAGGIATPAQSPTHESQHRPDIDGLRAIAILSVLGFHANSRWLPGGFVGVDIFFVISGYLISGIIFGGLQRGRFSFADFYARRVKRIFPALLVVLTASLLYGWFALYSDEYQMLGKHVAAGSAFVANIVYWREAGYFDPAGTLKPLLHLWSLGIEEQFYFIWPPILCLLQWRRIKPLPVLIAITLGSFALNLAWIPQHEIRTFYFPATRLWELSLGGVLACAQFARNTPRSTDTGNASTAQQLCSFVGLTLLIVSILAFTKFQQFPGWRAALPTLGSFLLIAAGGGTWINRVLLGNRLMVFVGLISYPLYLWHWPLLSFQRIVAGQDLPPTELLVTLAIAILLAWLTYRFVERPIRTRKEKLRPSLALTAAVALIGAIGLASALQRIQPRSAAYGLEKIIAASYDEPFPGPHLHEVADPLTTSIMDPVRKQSASRQTVLFLGDSQAEQYYPRIDQLLTQNPLQTRSVVYSTSGGCPPIPGVREDHLPKCDGLIERGIALSRSPDIDRVVLIADWMGYYVGPYAPEIYSYYYADASIRGVLTYGFGTAGSNQAFVALQSMIAQFISAHKSVYLVLPSPSGLAFVPRSMIARSLTDYSFRVQAPIIPTESVVSRMQAVVTKLRQIAADTGAQIIDPVAALCDASVCPVTTATGQLIYKDGGHLNSEYVKDNVRFLDDVVRLGR